jgi:hypothetical protein
VRPTSLRNFVLDCFYFTVLHALWLLVRSPGTRAHDQTIRYPPRGGASKYTFSFWAFPEERYPETLREFFSWVLDYERTRGYRTDIGFVAYRIARDDGNLFSYSQNGPVITIDPVSTGNPGWDQFLRDYNQWCSDHGGVPLLNQSDGLEAAQLKRALGDRLATFERRRRQLDPRGKLLNPYFRELLDVRSEDSKTETAG